MDRELNNSRSFPEEGGHTGGHIEAFLIVEISF